MTAADSLTRYYCSAGKGMEPFLVEELKRKLGAADVYQVPGKVLFSSSAKIHRVCDLKAAERLFLLLKQDSPLKMPDRIRPAKAASLLQSRLLGDKTHWISAVRTWSRLQGEVAASRNADRASDTQKARESEKLSDQDMHLQASRKRAHEFTAEESDGKKLRGGEESTRLSPDQENMDNLGGDAPLESVGIVSFRVNCKCSGSLSRCFSTQNVSKVMGMSLSRSLGWKADLKNPKLEISINLNDDYCLLGIQLTRLPLANRSYIKTTGLRSTIAWAMASLAQIQPGFCVVDPMCGVGTILIEAAKEHKAACFLGVDNDDAQLQRADENVVFAELQSQVHLLKASSMALPLPSASVDAVVCDLPFGRKFSSIGNMAEDLPLILSEMERVLRVGGILVMLLSPQLSCLLKKHLSQTHCGLKCNAEAESQPGMKTCIVSSSEQQDSQIKSPSSQGTSTLSSLRHQTTVRVSLGAIDGLIHKYIKALE